MHSKMPHKRSMEWDVPIILTNLQRKKKKSQNHADTLHKLKAHYKHLWIYALLIFNILFTDMLVELISSTSVAERCSSVSHRLLCGCIQILVFSIFILLYYVKSKPINGHNLCMCIVHIEHFFFQSNEPFEEKKKKTKPIHTMFVKFHKYCRLYIVAFSLKQSTWLKWTSMHSSSFCLHDLRCQYNWPMKIICRIRVVSLYFNNVTNGGRSQIVCVFSTISTLAKT